MQWPVFEGLLVYLLPNFPCGMFRSFCYLLFFSFVPYLDYLLILDNAKLLHYFYICKLLLFFSRNIQKKAHISEEMCALRNKMVT